MASDVALDEHRDEHRDTVGGAPGRRHSAQCHGVTHPVQPSLTDPMLLQGLTDIWQEFPLRLCQ